MAVWSAGPVRLLSRPPVITPRTALILHTAAEILSDEVMAALEDPDGWDEFPPFFRHLSPVAVERFRTAFLDLAADLAHGVEPHPRTNAEEMALHLMTDRATVELELGTCFPNATDPVSAYGLRCRARCARRTHPGRSAASAPSAAC